MSNNVRANALVCAQRYGQSSMLRRSALEFIAEEMLAAKAATQGASPGAVDEQEAAEPEQAAPTSCPVAPGGRPIVTSPSDPPLEFLYAQLSFSPDGTADRGQLSSGLQRLGAPLCGTPGCLVLCRQIMMWPGLTWHTAR